jgi:hypothetical protein
MNPQKSNKEKKEKELQKQADIKNAIETQSAVSNNEKTLNDSYSSFVNSDSAPEALIRAAQNVPEGLIRSIVWKYVKTINSILSKTLFYLGVELGSSDEDITSKAKEATKNIQLLTNILIQVLDDPEVKENVRQLAIELNSAVLKPFLEAALITLNEMAPQIDEASDEVSMRLEKGLRKLGDAVVGAAEGVIGTTPYIGNVWNAGASLMNTLQGVQAIVDNYTAIVLDQTLQLLLILQKVGGPAMGALDSWVNFALNANNALVKFKNQYDKLSASMEQKEFTKTPLKTKESLMGDLQNRAAALDMPEAPGQKDAESLNEDELEGRMAALDMPEAPTKPPVSKQKKTKVATTPIKAGGGKRKKRKKKTKKRNQKKRTKHKSRRRK